MMAHGDNDLAIGDKVTAQLSAIRGKAGSIFCESEMISAQRSEAIQSYAER